jgi:hypothetical protein
MRVRGLTLSALLVAGLAVGFVPSSPAVARVAAATALKVAIVVGATESTTATYKKYADSVAAAIVTAAGNAGVAVAITKVYSPSATWANVQAAVNGASIVIYHGHGNGWPSPYTYDPYFTTKDGFGLNSATNASDSVHVYYGETSVRTLRLAPSAIVLLGNLCYASGDSEPGLAQPSLSVAKQRADNYAAAFIQAGASAVIADGIHGLEPYIYGLFSPANAGQTIDQLWLNTNRQNHVISYGSTRSPGMSARLDPDTLTNGTYTNFYRSIVTDRLVTAGDVVGRTAVAASATGGAGLTPMTPSRILDTAAGTGLTGPFTMGSPRTVQVTGVGSIPSDAVAVALNVTVTAGATGGFVTLGPTVTASPTTSTINFPAGDTRTNGAIVPLAADGTLGAVYKGAPAGATVDVALDVTGYFRAASGAGLTPIAPARVLDTRNGTGLSGTFKTGTPRTLQVAGSAGVPSDAVAVAVNATVPANATGGVVSVGPTMTASPSISTVSFPAGDNRASASIVPLAANGSLAAVYRGPSGSATNFVLDVTGYFRAGSGGLFTPLAPVRMLDTRSAIAIGGAFRNANPVTVRIAGLARVPADAVAVAANVTVPSNAASGYVSVAPTVSSTPSTSTINFPARDNRANGAIVPLTADGRLGGVFKGASGTTAHVVLDVTGYFR